MKTTWVPIAPLVALMTSATLALPSKASPQPAELLPPNTAYTISIDMRQETWDQLNQYALFQHLQAQGIGAPSPGGLTFLPELDYETLIAPWVGDEAAIALLPNANPTGSVIKAITENTILIAPIAQPDIFAELFDDDLVEAIATLKQREPVRQTYEGIEIAYWEPLFLEEPDDSQPDPQSDMEPSHSPQPPALEPRRIPAPPLPSTEDNGATPELLKAVSETEAAPPWSLESWPTEPGLAIAVFPEFIVAAEDPTAIRAWMDLRPTEVADSLAQNERFGRSLEHPHYDEALGVLYGNFSELGKYSLTDLSLPDLPFNLPLPPALLSPDVAQLAARQLDGTVEVLVYPQARGLRLQGRGYFDDALLSAIAAIIEPAPTATLSHIPGDSYALINGQNIAGAWQQLVTTLEATEETKVYLDQARGFFTAFTGLDLDEDVFGWMDQGFSIFLYPTSKTPLAQIFPQFRVGLGVALQTSDRATADATFATFDGLVENFDIAVEPTTLEGQPATGWSDLLLDADNPESFLGRTWVDDDTLLLTTSLEALADLAQLEPAQALPNAFRFVESTRDFPPENQGYLFANTAPIRALVSSIFPPNPDSAESLEFRKLAASVQALSGTISFQADYAQVDGLLLLAPAEQP